MFTFTPERFALALNPSKAIVLFPQSDLNHKRYGFSAANISRALKLCSPLFRSKWRFPTELENIFIKKFMLSSSFLSFTFQTNPGFHFFNSANRLANSLTSGIFPPIPPPSPPESPFVPLGFDTVLMVDFFTAFIFDPGFNSGGPGNFIVV